MAKAIKAGDDGIELTSPITGNRYYARPMATLFVHDERDFHLFQKEEVHHITEVLWIGEKVINDDITDLLIEAGFKNLNGVRNFVLVGGDLTEVKGIGEKKSQQIMEALGLPSGVEDGD